MPDQKKYLILLVASIASGNIFANPVLSNHVAPIGATVNQTNPLKTVINQSDSHAIINWHSFNIGNNEETHFEQPRGGVAVNRINPKHGVSEIYGHLSATGQVVLINQAGIHFGPGSKVDVGSIIAKSHHSIINDGTINANNYGLVALLSPTVANHGVINAKLGTIVLASANKFTLDFYGDELINFAIDKEFTEGKGVENTGALYADGGRILVTAKAAQNIVDNVINMQGIAQANRVEEHNGEIVIYGGEHGKTGVDAELNASSGKVHIDGEIVEVNHAKINVSGEPAGEILIGGDKLGKHIKLFKKELPNAQKTFIYPGAELMANAITKGDGGNIVVWSDDITAFIWDKNNPPVLSAVGGALVGHGGTIETSGKHLYLSNVDIRFGKGGMWTLDPLDVTVSNNPTANGAFFVGNPETFVPSGNSAIANAGQIVGFLNAGTGVRIITDVAGGQAGNLTISVPISWNTSATLGLSAANDIFINGRITAPNGTLQLAAAGQSSGMPSIFVNQAIQVGTVTIFLGQFAQGSLVINAINSGQPTLTDPNTTIQKMYAVTSNIKDINKQQQALDTVLNNKKINTKCK